MKFPKIVKRYCPYCKKHTKQKITNLTTGRKRSALKKGSRERARKRGEARGKGNLGRWSKPAISKWKRKTKSSKKTNLLYRCQECGKATLQKKGKRAHKVLFKEK